MGRQVRPWDVKCIACAEKFVHYGEPQKCPNCGHTRVIGQNGSDLPNRIFTIYWEQRD